MRECDVVFDSLLHQISYIFPEMKAVLPFYFCRNVVVEERISNI